MDRSSLRRLTKTYAMRCVLALSMAGLLPLFAMAADKTADFGDFLRRDQESFQSWKTDGRKMPEQAAPVNRAQPSSKTVTYNGRAEADGRAATLTLRFENNMVSGHLQAKGVNDPNMHLPSTDVSFAPVTLTGPWEAAGTILSAPWTGGDYNGGALVPGYPTAGVLSLQLAERDGKAVVYLHRISSSQYGYAFAPKGNVYTPSDADASETATGAGMTNLGAVSSGYWNPVGTWTGSWQPAPAAGTVYSVSYQAVLASDGAVVLTVTGSTTEDTVELSGKWARKGMGIEMTWSTSALAAADIDDASSVIAIFDGPDCLIYRTEDGLIRMVRKSGNGSSTSPPGVPPVDLDQIGSVVLSPETMRVVPGTNYPLPALFGKVKHTGELVVIPHAAVDWTGAKQLTLDERNNRFEVSAKAVPGSTGTIRAKVKLGPRQSLASCEICVVKEMKVGCASGSLWLALVPRLADGTYRLRPRSAQILLNGPGGSRLIPVGSDGQYQIDNLEEGHYRLTLKNVQLPDLPPGYVASQKESIVGFEIPYFVGNPWHVMPGLSCTALLQPDLAYCVYGTVTCKDEPIRAITVTLAGHNGASLKRVQTDADGFYCIDTQGLNGGSYSVTALKMVGDDVFIATDGDLMDIPSGSNGEGALFVGLPVNATGLEVNIPCLTRKDLFAGRHRAP